jgi:hypothetical protein
VPAAAYIRGPGIEARAGFPWETSEMWLQWALERSLPMLTKHILVLSASIAALGLARPAEAGPIFDYVSSVNIASAPSLPSNPPGFGAAVIAIGSGNSLTFATSDGTGIDGSLMGGADINYGTITFDAGTSSTVVSYAVNFDYAVTITDEASGEIGTVDFTGQIAGLAKGSPRAINSTILDYAVDPMTLALGDSIYTISIGPSVGPGSFFAGVLQGNILVTPVTSIPEPAPAVLGGIGLLVLCRRRRSTP